MRPSTISAQVVVYSHGRPSGLSPTSLFTGTIGITFDEPLYLT
ncbi:Uncharacterised protein [Mycobacterium tuberculosis]|nr:Uncharacterised protein [Mycobacterium tuberculosis]